MPGNEIGDRVHNFFDQRSLSQDQRHTQLVDANWPVFGNNIWGASNVQIGGPSSSSSKSYNAQQSEIERGQGNEFSLGANELNFARSNLRPEFVKSPSQLQQLNLNGFMHTSQVGHTRQNEANVLGVDTEPDRHNMTSRGSSILESQQRSGSQYNNSASLGGSESPMNFNFLTGQQQMSGQQSGMLQSLPLQQSVINDTQVLRQQVMLKQMQELQRQQQLQQLEAIQRSAVSHISSFPNQTVGQHSLAINGNPTHDASNYTWPPQVMAGNTNWQQRGVPSAVHGYSNGLVMTPDQAQAMQFMGLLPQQAPQSLYGVPVSSSRSANPFSYNNIDKPGGLQVSAPTSSFSGNQCAPHVEQVSMQDRTTVSRSGSEGKSSFEHTSSQDLGNVVNLGGFTQVQQSNASLSEGVGQGFAGGTELLPEKSVTQAAPQGASSQNAVALDPTEEKILFGNDENIWEAFGGASLTGSGDGTDLFNGFPSVQSGTWSALMQSAVGETSSTDTGVQEEWSGLGSQNLRSQSRNQRSLVSEDNEKRPPNWVDSSQRSSLGSQTATNYVSTNKANVYTNYVDSSGAQKPFSNQRRERFQSESQISQEGMRWPYSKQLKPHVEGKRVFENSYSSRDCSKTDTGFWGHQQTTFLHDNSDQPSGRPSALNFIESVPVNGVAKSTNHDKLHDKDHNMQTCTDTGRGAAMRLEPVSNSNFRMGGLHVNAAGHGLNNMKVNHESSQKLPDNHHLDLWKSVNSPTESGFEVSGKDQHNLNKGPHVLESSVNTVDGAAAEMHAIENGGRTNIFSCSHRGSFPLHAPVGSLEENMWTDAADQRGLPGAKAKQVLHSQSMSQHMSSGVKGDEAQPRFLGPLSTNSADIEKGWVSGFHGAVNISHGVPSSAVRPGLLPSSSASFVRSGEISSPNQHTSTSQNMLELLHKVDQSKEQNAFSHVNSTEYNRMSGGEPVGPSQSQSSTSHGFSLQLAPPSQGTTSSNLNDGAQSSSRPADSPSSGYVASEKGDKTHAWLASSVKCLPPSHLPTPIECGTESGSLGNTDADGSLPSPKGNLSSPLASRRTLQSQHMNAPGGKMISDRSSAVPFNRHTYHDQPISHSQPHSITDHSVSYSHNNLVAGRDMNQSGIRASMHQTPASMHAIMAGMSRKDNLSPLGANLWPSQQKMMGAQSCNASDLVKSQFQLNDASETSSFIQDKDEQDVPRTVDASGSQGIVGSGEPLVAEGQSTGKPVGQSQEGEPSVRHLSDASPSNSVASQKDIELFQHSLKPNDTEHHGYSSLHQMLAMKSMSADPSHRESKRLRGPDNGLNTPQVAEKAAEPLTGDENSMVRDSSMSRTSVSTGDAKMLSFSPQPGNRNTSFQLPHGTVVSQDMFSFGRSDFQKITAGNVAGRAEHTGISPQMAPTWFEQYGTFKNGQLLSMHNIPRVPMMKNVEQEFITGKSPSNLVVNNSVQLENAVTGVEPIANTYQTANAYTPSEHVSSLHALVPHVSTPSSASMRSKKRKTATSDLLPWSKEIGQSLKRLQNVSAAEVDWAQSSNRLVEKIEDETDINEDLLPMIRPKRRLILTTLLMQQVFRPPTAAVLSLDLRSNYEIVVYSLARLALGDACSLTCRLENDSPVASGNLKVKTSETIRDQYFSKVMEDFVSRTKELENGLLRLDKRTSILDFRLDCEDLERFSVINRFAKFHGRGQVDGAETLSSSDASASAQKPCPLRYVSAHPMPRNVPERVQCLSL